jgi:hypothetical protein
MIVAELRVELVGVSDVLVNGRNVMGRDGKHIFDEKVFLKQFSVDQQHMVICEMRQLLAKMVDAHRRRQAAVGEIGDEQYKKLLKSRVRSGSGGIRGTDIGPL